MPIVKVWCLPADLTENQLRDIHKSIVAAAVSVKELGIIDEKSMTTLFPKDMMGYGLGTEIIIEVTSRQFNEHGPKTRNHFAQALVEAVQKFFPKAMVECFILPFGIMDGFFHSPPKRSP